MSKIKMSSLPFIFTCTRRSKRRRKKVNYADHETKDYTKKTWFWYSKSQPLTEVVFEDAASSQKTPLPSSVLSGDEVVTIVSDGIEHLELKRSSVEGAGLGLFTSRPLYAGDTVTRFLGEKVKDANGSVNAMELDDGLHDPARNLPYAFAHFINSKPPKGEDGANVVAQGDTGAIKAMYDLKAGTELFLYYGKDHPMYQ